MLQRRLGVEYYQKILPPEEAQALGEHMTTSAAMASLLAEFEVLKLSFSGDEAPDHFDNVPLPRACAGIPDNPYMGIEDGELRVFK
jgi:hypothetical protein